MNHKRKSIRLSGYDYAQAGAYFVTICCQDREELLGEIVNGEMVLNEFGNMVLFSWNDLVNHVAGIELDEFVIMPNHVHGIVVIVGDGSLGAGLEPALTVGAGSEPAPTGNVGHTGTIARPAPARTDADRAKRQPLSEIVRQFKTFSARRINEKRGTPGIRVWQRNYWEHIIRNDEDYGNISAYILNNPGQWELDSLHVGDKT